MSEHILVSVAWPYANGSIHIGQVAGALLPADIFARYHRMRGNEVLMVSGSDAHGTPVTLTAEARGTTPEQVYEEYQGRVSSTTGAVSESASISSPRRTRDNHTEVAQDIFLRLFERGRHLRGLDAPALLRERWALPRRQVRGKVLAPTAVTRGRAETSATPADETLDPQDLIDMTCKLCTGSPVIRETEHFFLRLSGFEERLLEWVRVQKHWRPNVLNFTTAFLEGGLHDRAITRDISWGVPVPLEGYEGKRIYVWFEAVIGYLSASKEWARRSGRPDAWREFWEGESRSYYFMGKDNIPFHTVIWPAMLIGYEGLKPPVRRAGERVSEPGGDSSCRPAGTGRYGCPSIWIGTSPTRCAM